MRRTQHTLKNIKTTRWRKISSHKIYSCQYLDLFKDKVINQLGKKVNYYYIRKKPFIAIIPRDVKGNIYFVRQYRYTLKRYTWEIPMGRKEDKESYLAAAKRELAEEACLNAKKWTKIGTEFVTSTAYPQHFWIYLAEDMSPIHKKPDPAEIDRVQKFTPAEIEKMIMKNQILGASILASLYKYDLYQKSLPR
ncbi:MAG: NUDIX hydrolase [Patescibacteria group bacterium]|nr:NUDIX hydrolase [Patescibacteria group bacterium]